MRRVGRYLGDFFDPLTVRALVSLALVGFLYPFFFSHLEFRHSLYGSIQSTLVIYDLPIVVAFLLCRFYLAKNGEVRRPGWLFLATWGLASLLICNSLCAPFILDFLLFAVCNSVAAENIMNAPSIYKFVQSYGLICKAIAVYSIPALIAAYGIFAILCAPLARRRVIRLDLGIAGALESRLGRIAWIRQAFPNAEIRSLRQYQLITACLGAAIVWPMHGTPGRLAMSYEQFELADRDNNGAVDPVEFSLWANHMLREDDASALSDFTEADSNHDATLDIAEWQRLFEKISRSGQVYELGAAIPKRC